MAEDDVKIVDDLEPEDQDQGDEWAAEDELPADEGEKESDLKEAEAEKPQRGEKSKPENWEKKFHDMRFALSEERTKRQQVEHEKQQLAQAFNPLRQEIDQWRAAQEAAQAQEDRDPIEVLTQEVASLKNEKQSQQRADEQARAANAEQAQFLSYLSGSVARYRATTPEYDEAYKFVVDRRVADYSVLGYAPMEAAQLFNNEAMQISRAAVARGMNPAEVVMNLARGWGWSAGSGRGSGSGPEEEEDSVAVGSASRTLSGKGGRSSGGDQRTIRLSDLEGMSAEDFDVEWEKLKRSGKLG